MTDEEYLADDARLLVWADELQQRGDPRGELIALQLGRPTRDGLLRQHELIAEHGKHWAGSLGRWFETFHFDRGLFAGGQLAPDFADLPGDPAWPQVTTLGLDKRDGAEIARLLDDPRSRVRRLMGLADAALPALLGRERRGIVEIEHLGWNDEQMNAELMTHAFTRLPDLRTLRLRVLTPTIASRLPDRLERLRIYLAHERVVESLAASHATLRSIEFTINSQWTFGWLVRLERDVVPGPFVKATLWQTSGKLTSPSMDRTLLHLMPTVPDDVRELEVDVGPIRLTPEAGKKIDARIRSTHRSANLRVSWVTGRSRTTRPSR